MAQSVALTGDEMGPDALKQASGHHVRTDDVRSLRTGSTEPSTLLTSTDSSGMTFSSTLKVARIFTALPSLPRHLSHELARVQTSLPEMRNYPRSARERGLVRRPETARAERAVVPGP